MQLGLAVIPNRGSIVVHANSGGDQMTLDSRRHFSLNARYHFVLLYTLVADVIRAAGEDINTALADDALAVGEEAKLPPEPLRPRSPWMPRPWSRTERSGRH
ncbi:hypothetical protein [Cryobacterium sp. GrIS_2_6]|uniref:hypothetical protein n=1 Tax=Cryobacterium sp. GrIS_2_6 TaxID=3162785 RepID=UPI002DF8E4AF|nr:hypothetical protein [Cryobacterium psychrotolerans]